MNNIILNTLKKAKSTDTKTEFEIAVKKAFSADMITKADMVELIDFSEDTDIDLEINKIEAEKYLKSTDWVSNKFKDYEVLGLDSSELTEKYKEILDKRMECRIIL